MFWAAVGLVVMMLAVAGLGGNQLSDIALKLQAASWPTVPGVVQSSQVSQTPGGRYGPNYHANIYYTYSVNSRNERSYLVAPFAQFGTGQAAAEELCNRYPVGRAVTVYYNHNKTYQSMLEPGFDWSVLAQLIFDAPLAVLILSAIASWLMLVGRRLSGKAPGGLLAFSEPLPRLRILRLHPILYAGLYGGGAGAIATFVLGWILGNHASPWAIIPGLLVFIGAFTGVWRFYHLRIRQSRFDIIVDPERQLLVIPQQGHEPLVTSLMDWNALRLTAELRWVGKGHSWFYILSLLADDTADFPSAPSPMVYESNSDRDVREIASWLSTQTGLPIHDFPKKKGWFSRS